MTRNNKLFLSSQSFVLLIAWVCTGFIVSFLFANFLINGKTMTPESFGTVWGASMVIIFSLGMPILVLMLRWQRRKKHRC